MTAEVKKRRINWYRSESVTNFYPQYSADEGVRRDLVSPIAPVQPTEFQRVEPRYQLSMSETRDTGLGPMFLETEYPTPAQRQRGAVSARPEKRPPPEPEPLFQRPEHPRKKVRTDKWG